MNYKKLELLLAEYKVYDSWEYVLSLLEHMEDMDISKSIISTVYKHRQDCLAEISNNILQKAVADGSATVTTNTFYELAVDICGVKLDDCCLLKKTSNEFFHYARICLDSLIQIANAALLGEKAIDVSKVSITKLLDKLKNESCFTGIYKIFCAIKDDAVYKYICEFDNFMKHIKAHLIVVSNSFMIGNKNEFKIMNFVKNKQIFAEEDAISKIEETYNFTVDSIEKILNEIIIYLPNCLKNDNRIQNVKFEQVFRKDKSSTAVEYTILFIEVKNELSELPSDLAIHPLLIKANQEIFEYNIPFDTIFIRKQGKSNNIVGCATKTSIRENDNYYVHYSVRSCTKEEYDQYLSNFRTKYPSCSFNMCAMEGIITLA
ncbi:MAG: hypothetical protein RR413_03975 [Christensenellaceae bacterium]